MPEIGPGIGRSRDGYQGVTREWLYWFDQDGNRYPTTEEWGAQEAQRAEQAEQELANLRERLRQIGIDPDIL